jgi:hypothetical protein
MQRYSIKLMKRSHYVLHDKQNDDVSGNNSPVQAFSEASCSCDCRDDIVQKPERRLAQQLLIQFWLAEHLTQLFSKRSDSKMKGSIISVSRVRSRSVAQLLWCKRKNLHETGPTTTLAVRPAG